MPPTHKPLRLEAAILSASARGDLALELGKRQEHVERQPPHRCGDVELLGDGDEMLAACVLKQ